MDYQHTMRETAIIRYPVEQTLLALTSDTEPSWWEDHNAAIQEVLLGLLADGVQPVIAWPNAAYFRMVDDPAGTPIYVVEVTLLCCHSVPDMHRDYVWQRIRDLGPKQEVIVIIEPLPYDGPTLVD